MKSKPNNNPQPSGQDWQWLEIIWKRAKRQGRYEHDPIKWKEFEQAIKDHFEKMMLEVIGEDEPLPAITYRASWGAAHGRNDLRQELRAKLKKELN